MFFAALTLLAMVNLDQMMSPTDMQNTGVNKLSVAQKTALGNWIDARFDVKGSTPTTPTDQVPLSISLNLDNGKRIQLSDNSVYEISPQYQTISSGWISPSIVKLEASGDPQYPVRIVSINSGTSVNARKVSGP